MKNIIIILITLVGGIFIGKFFFANQNNSAETTQNGEHVEEHWTCSMHPQIDLPEFGACPICGMDLIPKDDSEGASLNENQFKMTKTAIALANIETTIIGEDNDKLEQNQLKLTGTIEVNDDNIVSQTAHISGRIERLFITSEGQRISKGQKIALIYSPELVNAQNELIQAMEIKESQPELFKAVRNRLKLWKLSEEQIQSVIDTKKIIINFPIYAEYSGTVIEKIVDEGNHVSEGKELYKIGNYNTVWAVFDVFEKDISKIRIGEKIIFSSNSMSDREISTKISFIDPELNTKTRTVPIRAVVSSKNESLKPGMLLTGYVDNIKSQSSKQELFIPKSAVLWTGKRSIVYVKPKGDEGIFELREIELGSRQGDNYLVLSGIKSGEEIVTYGAFTIDAAAQLQGRKSMMSPRDKYVETYELSSQQKKNFSNILEDYFRLKDAFVATNAGEAANEVIIFSKSLNSFKTKSLKHNQQKTWKNLVNKIKEGISQISDTKDVERQREGFQIISDNMISLTKQFGKGIDKTYVQFCPMAFDNAGAFWLSPDFPIRNPYFGDKMLKCGSVKDSIY